MSQFNNKLAFIVPTKDHPQPLRRMLASVADQSCLPDQMIIVDGGDETVEGVVTEFPTLNLQYVRLYPPSLAKQRNAGIAVLDPSMTLAGYLDDDLVLEPGCLHSLLEFWETAPESVGGVRFNIITDPLPKATPIKSLFLMDSSHRGKVLRSGFVAMIGQVKENKYVNWLSGGATCWRTQVVKEFEYDEWFEGTGFLEDVDYSYRVNKKYQLVVIADAQVQHLSSPVRKEINYVIGKWQAINRMYFIKKNPELSPTLFYWAMTGEVLINLAASLFRRDSGRLRRALGNFAGLATVTRGRSERIGGVYK